MSEDTKRWYQSKTLWINAALAAFTALEASTGMLQPHLPFNVYFALSMLVPAVNAILRYVTTKPIT